MNHPDGGISKNVDSSTRREYDTVNTNGVGRQVKLECFKRRFVSIAEFDWLISRDRQRTILARETLADRRLRVSCTAWRIHTARRMRSSMKSLPGYGSGGILKWRLPYLCWINAKIARYADLKNIQSFYSELILHVFDWSIFDKRVSYFFLPITLIKYYCYYSIEIFFFFT